MTTTTPAAPAATTTSPDLSFNNKDVNWGYALALIAFLAVSFLFLGRTFTADGVVQEVTVTPVAAAAEEGDASENEMPPETVTTQVCNGDYDAVKAEFDTAAMENRPMSTCQVEVQPLEAAPNAVWWAFGIAVAFVGAIMFLERMKLPNLMQILGGVAIGAIGLGVAYIVKMEEEPDIWAQVFVRGLVSVAIIAVSFVAAHYLADSSRRRAVAAPVATTAPATPATPAAGTTTT